MWKPALVFAAGVGAGWTLCLVTSAARRDAAPAQPRPESRAAEAHAERAPDAPTRRPPRGARPPQAPGAEAPADTATSHDSGGAAPSPRAVEHLAQIEAAARDGTDGARVLQMATEFRHMGGVVSPDVPSRLVKELTTRGGDFGKAGAELVLLISDGDARAELRSLAADGAQAAAWGTPDQREWIALVLLRRFRDRDLPDDDVRLLASAKSPALRAYGISQGTQRRLVSWKEALASARTDPDSFVRTTALGAAWSAAGEDDAAEAAVADEIVAFARSDDPLMRAFGVDHLGITGARGAAVAREVLDQGGLDAGAYESAVTSLIAARRFDRLAPEGLDDDSRVHLVTSLYSAYSDDPSTRPQVIEAIRSMGSPTSAQEVEELAAFASDAGALELVFDAAKDKAAPVAARSRALNDLLAETESRDAAVRLAGEVLGDPPTTASQRRIILDEIGTRLIAAGDAGIAVLRHVADHDANAQIRGLAARQLRDAGK
jgi:hypothetical protein